jgi:hypothetical protein
LASGASVAARWQQPMNKGPITPPSGDAASARRPPPGPDQTTVLPAVPAQTTGAPPPGPDETALLPRLRFDSGTTSVLPRVPAAPVPMSPQAIRDGHVQGPAIPRWRRSRNDGEPVERTGPIMLRLPVLGRAPEMLLVSAIGVVLVAFAYAAGWTGRGGGLPAYWIGQVVVFVPVVARLLSRRLAGSAESFLLVIGLAVNQYLFKWMYSPDQFRFPDELQHWAGTTLLLDSGQLYQHNTALPVAVHFPGLEEVGAAVASLTGLSVTDSGLIVAGLAHLVFVAALFALVRSVGGSPAFAGVACVIYATALHYLFFDSMYIYQTIALPFLILAVWASRTWRWGERRTLPYAVIGVISIVVVTVSHHVTSFVMVGTLGLLALFELLYPDRPRRRGTLVLACVSALTVLLWIAFPARDVTGYFQQPVADLIDSVKLLISGAHSPKAVAPAPNNPLWQLVIQALGLVALLTLLLRAGWSAVRSRLRDPWQWALLVGGLLFFGTTGLRFFGAQGPELAGRAATFTYLPMSIIAGAALAEWRRSMRPQNWPGVLRAFAVARPVLASPVLVGAALSTVLMIGARAGGWPPDWERIPGPFKVDAFERGVDAQGVAAGQWSRYGLGMDRRIACDISGCILASSYGGLDPVGYASILYTDPVWGLSDEQLAHNEAIELIWIDLRLSEQVPITDGYFPIDPQIGQHRSPIPRSSLTKFDGLPGADRLYDSGDIRIYDLGVQ